MRRPRLLPRATRAARAAGLGRAARLAVAVLAVAGATGATAGCGGPPAGGYEPTLPSVNFTPKLVVTVDDDAVRITAGPRADDRVSVDPPRAAQGTVIELVNAGRRPHRLRATNLFDSGVLQPGDKVTVALTKETAADTAYDITDLEAPDRRVSLTLTPRPTP